MEEGITLIDEKGEKHESGSRSSGGSADDYKWDYEFPAKIPKPQKTTFRWIREFKTVEIPFRFEGIAIP